VLVHLDQRLAVDVLGEVILGEAAAEEVHHRRAAGEDDIADRPDGILGPQPRERVPVVVVEEHRVPGAEIADLLLRDQVLQRVHWLLPPSEYRSDAGSYMNDGRLMAHEGVASVRQSRHLRLRYSVTALPARCTPGTDGIAAGVSRARSG